MASEKTCFFNKIDGIINDMGKYTKAPIEEAVFDIKIDPALAVGSKDIESLHPQISEHYPEKEILRTFQTTLKVNEGVPSSFAEDKGIIGFRFWDKDKKQVCRFGLDGFSLSRLRPYDDWEIHFPEVLRLWGIYREKLKPRFIKRVAARFVNVIEIPAKRFELKDYFVDPPKPPKGLPQSLTGFISRMTLKYDDGPLVQVTLALQKPHKANVTPILLDIDVFTENKFPSDDESQLQLTFDKLHKIKNDVFEKYLQNKTKELIQ